MATAYEVVKSHYDANDRGDMDGMLAVLSQDAKWTEMAGYPYKGTYTGPQEVFDNVFAPTGEDFDGFTCTIDDLIDGGDKVVAIGRYTGTAKNTGKEFEARVTHVWRVEDGKVVEFEQFVDTLLIARALEQY